MQETEYGWEYEAEVLASKPLTPTCHMIRVSRHPDFDYEPVQYTFLSLKTEEADDYSDYRPMSLASSPTRDHLEYGARIPQEDPSPWKAAFQALEPGDKVLVEGPAGDFILDEDRPAVMIAGGIGITPLKGMVEYITDKGLDLGIMLLYSNRTPQEIAYRDVLDDLSMENMAFELVYTVTRPSKADEPWDGRTGRIDRKLLEPIVAERKRAAYYVCGGPQMVKDMVALLGELGIPETRLVYEQFWGYD